MVYKRTTKTENGVRKTTTISVGSDGKRRITYNKSRKNSPNGTRITDSIGTGGVKTIITKPLGIPGNGWFERKTFPSKQSSSRKYNSGTRRKSGSGLSFGWIIFVILIILWLGGK